MIETTLWVVRLDGSGRTADAYELHGERPTRETFQTLAGEGNHLGSLSDHMWQFLGGPEIEVGQVAPVRLNAELAGGAAELFEPEQMVLLHDGEEVYRTPSHQPELALAFADGAGLPVELIDGEAVCTDPSVELRRVGGPMG